MIKLVNNLTTILILLTFVMVSYMHEKVRPRFIVFTERIVDTVFVDRVITNVVYRDTSDSQFMKAILEAECGYFSKKARGRKVYPPVGDGGRAIGIFQMHECYFNGCPITKQLGYKYMDMFNEEKATIVFWAKTAIYAYRYKKKYNKLPTFMELASIHNAGFYRPDRAVRYREKFKRNYYRRL